MSFVTRVPPDFRPRVWVGRDDLIYVGPALGSRPHSTAVSRVLVALDQPFVLDWGGAQREYHATVIPPRVRHRVVTPGVWWAVMYLGPGSHRDVRSRECLPDPERLADLASLGEIRALLEVLGPEGGPRSRVSPVLDRVLEDPSRPLSAEQAAQAVGLSTSHFLREFSAATGTTYRRFCQWSRLLEVARHLNGQSLTVAAVEAGFASPSHFSDTVRAIFGFTATELLRTRADIAAM